MISTLRLLLAAALLAAARRGAEQRGAAECREEEGCAGAAWTANLHIPLPSLLSPQNWMDRGSCFLDR